MRGLPERGQGRLLAVVLALIALVLGYLLFVHWWFVAPLAQSRGDLIEARQQEFKLRTEAQQKPAIDARLAEVRAFEANNAGFLPEGNFDLAAASLIQRLQSSVEVQGAGEGCQIVSSQPSRTRDEEVFVRVTVKVRLRCEVDYLLPVLHGLETSNPQLFVDSLLVDRRGAQARRRDSAPTLGPLDVNFDLYGYLRERAEVPK